MERSSLKLLGGGAILTLVIFVALFMYSGNTQAVHSSTFSNEIDNVSSCSEDEEVYLGDGAYAIWGGSDFTATELSASVPRTQVVIFGADELYKMVHITATLEIGYIQQVVLEKDIELYPKAEVTVPIMMPDAFSLHSRQQDHVTRLKIELSATYDGDTEPQFVQRLDPRYIVSNQRTAKFEVMSPEVKNERYPYGVLNDEELQEAMKTAEELAEQNIHLEGVGSGVEFSTNDPQEFAEFINNRQVGYNDSEVEHE